MNKNYRADIDGLRAIAILSVVIFHAWPNALRAGFIGVDIFFVISGFLISGIIFKSLDAGTFSFIDFYQKRIRRIFPALVTVLLACLLLGWRVMLSDEFQQLGKHALAGGGFFINFILKREVGYFEKAVELKPLLHLWSLAIEEQFYILWPLLLWAAWKRKWSLWKIAVVIFIISFARNIMLAERRPVSTFYMLDTRLWELIAGALLAYLKLYGKPLKSATLAHLSSTAGLVLLATGLVVIDKNRAYPSWWALLPVGGAVLLIFAGQAAWFNRYVLSSKPLVWIGLISYPLYLWHWPILSFATIMEQDQNRLLLVLLSFTLAWLTYQYIEKPIRFKKQLRFSVGLSTAMITTVIIGFLISQQSIKNQSNILDAAIVKATVDIDEDNDIFNGQKMFGLEVKTFINPNSKHNVLFVGDSHMAHNYPRLKRLSQNSASSIFFLTSYSNSIFGMKRDVPWTNKNDTYPSHIIDIVEASKINTVVIQNNWQDYIGETSKDYFLVEGKKIKGGSEEGRTIAFDRMEALLSKLNELNVKVYVIAQAPTGAPLSPHSTIKRSILNGNFYAPQNLQKVDIAPDTYHVDALIKALSMKYGASVIDPFEYLCNAKECFTAKDGDLIYRDHSHLRASFVREHLRYLDQTIN